MKTNNIIVSIETAIDGGSLSLQKDSVEIVSWMGMQQVSKAEDILEKISELLKDYNIQKSELNFVAVSNGPGSSTGIKIGLAVAKGIGNALNIQVKEVSIFAALLAESEDNLNGITIAVLPIGKNLLCRQIFDNKETIGKGEYENPKTLSAEEFKAELIKTVPGQVVFQKKAYQTCQDLLMDNKLIENFFVIEKNLAYLIGKSFFKTLRV
jgi:tRNA threonylcarbamoyl adenosine modification protein YeaZ